MVVYINLCLQILDLAVKEGLMNIPKLTVPGFKCPLFPGVQVSQSHVVNNHILHQGVPELMIKIPIDAYLDVDVALLFDFLHPFVARHIVLLQQVQAVQFLDGEKVDEILTINWQVHY